METKTINKTLLWQLVGGLGKDGRKQLSEATGISLSLINKLLSDHHEKVPSKIVRIAIANHFGKTEEEIFPTVIADKLAA